MTHALAANRSLGDLYTASIADHALIAYLFVLAAVALPVLCGSEYLLAEESVLFGL